MSGKSKPLPSILAQMRNATLSMSRAEDRSSRFNTTIETQNLIDTPSLSRSTSTAVQRLLNLLNSSGRTYARSKKTTKRKLDQGFHVQLPSKFLVYTILIFIVLPLVLGSIFLIKQLLFGTLKEDEFHHLRKKEIVRPHVVVDSNVPSSDVTTMGQEWNNATNPVSDIHIEKNMDVLSTNSSVNDSAGLPLN
jgi:hypothetical protein